MKNKGLKVNVKIDTEGENVEVTLTEETKNKIPRPGDSIYIVQPYPQIDPEDVDGEEIKEDDLKQKPVMGYSYDALMVKGSVLSDDNRSVLVNGDYNIPLFKDAEPSSVKLMVFTKESKAIETWKTLMEVSLAEVTRREKLQKNIRINLEESIEKMYH